MNSNKETKTGRNTYEYRGYRIQWLRVNTYCYRTPKHVGIATSLLDAKRMIDADLAA